MGLLGLSMRGIGNAIADRMEQRWTRRQRFRGDDDDRGMNRRWLPRGLEKKDHLPPGWRKKIANVDNDDQKGARDRREGQSPLQFTGNVKGGQGTATVGAGNSTNSLAGLSAGIEHLGLTGATQPTQQPLSGNSIGGQLLNAQYMQPLQSGSAIIDTNVLTAARGGDTVGFINALAGNVNASLNNAVNQFMALTG